MRRPRIKPEHEAVQTASGEIRIGSDVFGVASSIADPDGWIWSLCQFLDGRMAPDDIAEAVQGRHASVQKSTILEAIN